MCWNNLYRKLFHFHRWVSVRVLFCKIDFLHISKLMTAKFFKHLSVSKNGVLRHVFYYYTVYGNRFLQLFHDLNLQLDCSVAAIHEAVFSHFNSMCDCA